MCHLSNVCIWVVRPSSNVISRIDLALCALFNASKLFRFETSLFSMCRHWSNICRLIQMEIFFFSPLFVRKSIERICLRIDWCDCVRLQQQYGREMESTMCRSIESVRLVNMSHIKFSALFLCVCLYFIFGRNTLKMVANFLQTIPEKQLRNDVGWTLRKNWNLVWH